MKTILCIATMVAVSAGLPDKSDVQLDYVVRVKLEFPRIFGHSAAQPRVLVFRENHDNLISVSPYVIEALDKLVYIKDVPDGKPMHVEIWYKKEGRSGEVEFIKVHIRSYGDL